MSASAAVGRRRLACAFAAALLLAAALAAIRPGFARAGGADAEAACPPPWKIRYSDGRPAQGEPVLVEFLGAPDADNAALVWKGRRFPMRAEGEGRFVGLVGVDLLDRAEDAPLAILASKNGAVCRAETALEIRTRPFPVQKLSLPRQMAEFDPATLERIRREASALDERMSAVTPPAWKLPLVPPVDAFRPRGFGARRLINGEPRSPHAGVDISLPEGTPVAAIAAGTVAFAGVQFFGGNSVVIDHGGGLLSLYYHLKDFSVAEGQRVSRGERIGAVGASGRAAGPHLHFGVRAAGGRVDPALLFGLAPH